jgi:hypothetical protein
MKKTIILLTIFISATNLFAQEPEVSWGTAKEAGSKDASYIPLGWYDEHYYAVQIDDKDGYLVNVNKSMDIEAQIAIVTGEKKFDVDLAFIRGGKLHLLMSNYESGEKTNYIRASTFTLAGRTTATRLKKIASFSVEKNNENDGVEYIFSADSSLLLILQHHKMKNDDPAKVSFTVVKTDGFTELWSHSEELPHDYKTIEMVTASVDNKGGVLLLGNLKTDEGKGLEKYNSVIFSCPLNSDFSETALKLDGKYISSATIRFVNDESAFFTGFYNDIEKKQYQSGIEGAFIAYLNPKNLEALEDMYISPFDPETKGAITRTGEAEAKGSGDELNGYSIQDVKLNTDGSGYVIAEQRVVYSIEVEGHEDVHRIYYFNNLIIYRFDQKKAITSLSTIPKLQQTTVHAVMIGYGAFSITYWPVQP